jgi:hypothetical protein
LYFGFGEHRGDGLGKTGQPVDRRQEDVLNSPVFQFIHNAHQAVGGWFHGLVMFFIVKLPGCLHGAFYQRLRYLCRGQLLHYPFWTIKVVGAAVVLENLIQDFW